MTGRIATAGSLIAVAAAVHGAVNVRRWRRPDDAAPGPESVVAAVSVLIPARDEGGYVGTCVRSVLGQDGVAEILVLDDRSSDATAAEARAAGARVIAGTEPPAGWLGKPWACAQLAAATDPATEVLVFVDADVRLAPGAVRAAHDLLRQSGLDLACPFPRQVAQRTERLVQPLLQWSWLTFLPLAIAERSRRPSLTAACGQFVLVRRDALARVGGFAAVRDEVLDDIALARAVKAAGGRASVVDGTRLATVRMYAGWPALRDGYGKSLWSAFGSPAGAVAVVAALGAVYVLPAVAALRGSRAGVVGYAAGVTSRFVAARATGGRAVPDAFAHPLSVVAFGYLTLRSVREHRRGTLRWKGRTVSPAGRRSPTRG